MNFRMQMRMQNFVSLHNSHISKKNLQNFAHAWWKGYLFWICLTKPNWDFGFDWQKLKIFWYFCYYSSTGTMRRNEPVIVMAGRDILLRDSSVWSMSHALDTALFTSILWKSFSWVLKIGSTLFFKVFKSFFQF